MKKKVVLLILVLLMTASVSTFAVGIGAGGTFGWSADNGLYGGFLSLKLDDWPLLGIDFSSSSSGFRIGATADWWQLNENLSGVVNWYWGLGGYGRLALGSPTSFALGARLPVGLNAYVLDPLELFIEAAPSVGASVSSGGVGLDWGVQGALGFRFWL
ncbi:MAG: hypothetical protein PQJ61_02150 [Spirochaetales bacterium]|uniref:Outer membrane protein beta-barrel domain-containing protein n=1 Tax=Candidatus Thalassospirochaeta sargassi TaxID=3119039 RepID=A0AAJ1ID14_9SPIO|nr:hypothetical protein [Spirochaetales bacterium]